MFKPINPTENIVQKEHQMLAFWQKNKIFDKLVKKNQGKKPWSFLDGPITANNPMAVHHAWGRTYKDLFQRYQAMQGKDQRFQNGFDCQGLWVEVEVEKELGFKTKKDIENYGIAEFVEKCKERVKKYAQIQTDQSIRLGQWMDWAHSYLTMSDANNYAIWHFLKKCHEKGYLYKGRDSVPWCPRCATAISQHEILTEEYQEITHQAIYLKLPIEAQKFKNTSFLVWTTTPWTIPANVALAVNPEFSYGVYSNGQESLILLRDLAKKILEKNFKLTKEIPGKELIGLKYRGPFDDLEKVKGTDHSVIDAKNLVTAEEGTGIVHLAPGAGSEDFQLAKTHQLPVIEVIDEQAVYLPGLGQFSGQNAKTHPEIIIDYLKTLAGGQYFYKIENYLHRYPTCWRCKTELVWRVVDEWYISMEKLRDPMMAVAKKIKWSPSFGLERELDWLKNMADWLISKKRYWGLALPIYECSCGHFEVIGSKEELKEKAVEGWSEFADKSPHRPWVDKVKIKCPKCGKPVARIPDVGNPWLDAGIVPFSTMGYFEDKKYWQKWFPADFICESFPGQFKNWFYSLIAMSTVLENTNPFDSVLGYALVRDEKGEEMHKSKGNAIWFDEAAEKMGADVMRWLFSITDPYENLNFGYHVTDEIRRRFILILKNVYKFFVTYANLDGWKISPVKTKDKLDEWIIALLNKLTSDVTSSLDKFQPNKAAVKIQSFVLGDLSTWYLRRSRARRDPEFYSVMYHVLMILVKLLAPFVPFMAEDLYQNLKAENSPESVHLCPWPKAGEINKELLGQMKIIRTIVELGHAIRASKGIRVRQPLSKVFVSTEKNLDVPLEWSFEIFIQELNIGEFGSHSGRKEIKKDYACKQKGGLTVCLDTKITPELQELGTKRDFIRLVQDLRKKANRQVGEPVTIDYLIDDEHLSKVISQYASEIQKQTSSKLNQTSKELPVHSSTTANLAGKKIWLGLKK